MPDTDEPVQEPTIPADVVAGAVVVALVASGDGPVPWWVAVLICAAGIAIKAAWRRYV